MIKTAIGFIMGIVISTILSLRIFYFFYSFPYIYSLDNGAYGVMSSFIFAATLYLVTYEFGLARFIPGLYYLSLGMFNYAATMMLLLVLLGVYSLLPAVEVAIFVFALQIISLIVIFKIVKEISEDFEKGEEFKKFSEYKKKMNKLKCLPKNLIFALIFGQIIIVIGIVYYLTFFKI